MLYSTKQTNTEMMRIPQHETGIYVLSTRQGQADGAAARPCMNGCRTATPDLGVTVIYQLVV